MCSEAESKCKGTAGGKQVMLQGAGNQAAVLLLELQLLQMLCFGLMQSADIARCGEFVGGELEYKVSDVSCLSTESSTPDSGLHLPETMDKCY